MVCEGGGTARVLKDTFLVDWDFKKSECSLRSCIAFEWLDPESFG